MDILTAGETVTLSRVTQRLAAQGHTISSCKQLELSLLRYSDSTSICCLLIDGCLISLGNANTPPPTWLLPLSTDYSAHAAELVGSWHPAGVELGFILFVGTSCPVAPLLSLLNALAPLPTAWLHCGPVGSATFTAQVFDKLAFTSGLAWQADGATTDAHGPGVINWGAYLAQHQTLITQLLHLCKTYLANQPPHELAAASQLLDIFARPPSEQPHYASHLAHVLLLAIGQL